MNNSTPSILNVLSFAQVLASAQLDHRNFVNFLTKTHGTLVAHLHCAQLSPKCASGKPKLSRLAPRSSLRHSFDFSPLRTYPCTRSRRVCTYVENDVDETAPRPS